MGSLAQAVRRMSPNPRQISSSSSACGSRLSWAIFIAMPIGLSPPNASFAVVSV